MDANGNSGDTTGDGPLVPARVRVLPAAEIGAPDGFGVAKAAFAAAQPQPCDPVPLILVPAAVAEGFAPAEPGAIPVPAAKRKLWRNRQPRPKRPKPPPRPGLMLMPLLIFLGLIAVFGGLALSGKPLRLPVWAVAEVETRINRAVAAGLGAGEATAAVSLGGIVLLVDRDWVPRLRLEDLRLLQPQGEAMVVVPEARVSFDPEALLRGEVRLRSLRLIGPRFVLRREVDGQFDIAVGLGMAPRQVTGFAGLIAAMVEFFAQPAMSSLIRIEAEALALTFDDRLSGQVWNMGDGRLQLDNRADDVAVQIGVSLVAGGLNPARADLTLIAAKAGGEAGAGGARLTVAVDQVAAADIAAQVAPLAFLAVLDAPISGQIASTLNRDGKVSALEATLSLAAGALRPAAGAEPVAFDSARLSLGYDPLRERMELREVSVQSATLRLAASGHAYLPGVSTGRPREVLGQVKFSEVSLDPEGLFQEPLRFEAGALDLRLRLDPFTLDIGQLSLTGDGRAVTASGQVQADPDGWRVSMDLGLDRIAHDRLLALWPRRLVPRTRDWISQNVLEGQLSNVRAALRLAPGTEPRLSLGYDFADARVRFLRTLPPITGGQGYAVIEGKGYLMRLSKGIVTPPLGGAIDAAGSVFAVPDVTQRPALAEMTLHTKASLTATLSLLDQPPFSFLTKARQPVALGEGRAETQVTLRLPLQKGVTVRDVEFAVLGTVRGFRSNTLVPDRLLEADVMTVEATPAGLTVSGKGTLQGVPFDATYRQMFGPQHAGRARIEAVAELSPETAGRLKLGLPEGLLSGKGQADLVIDLARGTPPVLRLTSDLAGVGLAIPTLGWRKPTGRTGRLEAEVRLGKPVSVPRLDLDAAGLRATGAVTLNPDGSLQLARFSRVRLDEWLDAAADLTGRGRARAPGIALTGGRVDLRGLPQRSGGGGAGAPLQLALDELVVTDGLRLTGFRSVLAPATGGLAGDFTARVNGAAQIGGSLAPTPRGAAVRIRSDDAGAVFSAARIFPNAGGGSFDLLMNPTGAAGEYDGTLKMANIRLRKAPALAELLSAISVVGLLEQMNGEGLLFSEAEAEFRLTPRAIQITRGSAVGASLGVSVEGVYRNDGGRLDMQGVISPIYLINGLGAFLTRRGEGLFGFNYSVGGTVKDPAVSVNPLSIFTPGMFREMFRGAPPRLEAAP